MDGIIRLIIQMVNEDKRTAISFNSKIFQTISAISVLANTFKIGGSGIPVWTKNETDTPVKNEIVGKSEPKNFKIKINCNA